MKAAYLTLIALLACTTAWSQATPDEHAAHHPPEAAAAPSKSAAPPDTGELEKRMQSMQELMDRVGKSSNAAERKRLLQQHSDAMHAQVHDLEQVACPMMMESGMSGGMMGSMMDKPAATPGPMPQAGMHGSMQGDMMRCHDMMKSRMDMMLRMMDQMLRHLDAATAGK